MLGALPLDDWQFWVVSVAALGATLWILRGLFRVIVPHARRGGRGRHATLTVGGKPVGPSRKGRGPRA